MSVVRIRKSPYYRGFFQKKIYENFVRTLETVHNIEVSILERCQYREVRLYWTTSLKYVMKSISTKITTFSCQ